MIITFCRCPQSCFSAMACLPLLLACLLVLCQSQATSETEDSVIKPPTYQYNSGGTRSNDNHLTDPGVIVGIVVGVVGVLVVLGVCILLCRLFCCKQSPCCNCCTKEEEVYHDLNTSPLKLAKPEASREEERAISIISPNRRPNARTDRLDIYDKEKSPQGPPQYDDLSQLDWKKHDQMNSNSELDAEADTRSKELHALPSVKERQRGLPKPGAKPKRKERTPRTTPARAHTLGLSTGEDDPDTTRGGKEADTWKDEYLKYNDPSYLNDGSRWEENPQVTGDGREYLPYGHQHQRHHYDLTSPGGRTNKHGETPGRTAGEETEFKPLELGLQKQHHSEGSSERWRDNPDTAGDRREAPPLDYRNPVDDPSCPDDRASMWGKDRRARDYGQAPATHALHSRGRRMAPVRLPIGTDNQAFNRESAETEV